MAPLSFLNLPAELRTRIYEYALLNPRPEQINRAHRADPEFRFRAPSLLQTCRLIRAEASPIYYAGNVFWIRRCYARNSGEVLKHWLSTLIEVDRACVKTVQLDNAVRSPARDRQEWLEWVKDHRKELRGSKELIAGIDLQVINHHRVWVTVKV